MPKTLTRFIATCLPSILDTKCCSRRQLLLLFKFYLVLQILINVRDLLHATFCVAFTAGGKCTTCRAHSLYKQKHKQEETSSIPKYGRNRLLLYPDRNCSALNNLCLFAIFPCGSASEVHYYLCTSNAPCFRGQTEFAQTVCHPHQRPRENLAGGCRGFGAVSGLPR